MTPQRSTRLHSQSRFSARAVEAQIFMPAPAPMTRSRQRRGGRAGPTAAREHRCRARTNLQFAANDLTSPNMKGGDRKHPDKCDGRPHDRQRSFQEATDFRATFACKHFTLHCQGGFVGSSAFVPTSSPAAGQHLAGPIEILQFSCLSLDQDPVTPPFCVVVVYGPPLVMGVCRGGARLSPLTPEGGGSLERFSIAITGLRPGFL